MIPSLKSKASERNRHFRNPTVSDNACSALPLHVHREPGTIVIVKRPARTDISGCHQKEQAIKGVVVGIEAEDHPIIFPGIIPAGG
jgi:hypothetical protein